MAPGMRHRGRADGRAAEGVRLRLWVGCGYPKHQTQTFTWPWPPLRLQTVRAELVSRPIPARMATAQWQVFDSSKDETHCSSPGRPSSTSFHGVGDRPAGSPDICESPPRQPDQVYRSASNQSASTHSGQPRRTSTQGTGTPQTPFHRVFWPPRLLRARVDRRSDETGEGG